MGLLTSDLKYDQMRTVFMTEGAIDGERLDRDLAAAAEELRGRLRRRRRRGRARSRSRPGWTAATSGRATSCGSRCRRNASRREALDEFHRPHEQEYGHAFRDPIEIVNLRVTAYGKRPRIEQLPAGANGGDAAARRGRERLRRHAPTPTRYYERALLPVGESIDGPAIVFQRDATTVVPPGWTARADASGSLILSQMSTPTDHARRPDHRRR